MNQRAFQQFFANKLRKNSPAGAHFRFVVSNLPQPIDRILPQKLVSKRRTVLARSSSFFGRFLTGILPESVLPRQNAGLFQIETG